VESIITEYNAEINLYSQHVQAYLGEMNALRSSELQEYSAKVQACIEKYTSQNTMLINEYQANVSQQIQEYANLIQGEIAKFNAGLSKATSYLQEADRRLGAAVQYANLIPAIELDIKSIKTEYTEGLKSLGGYNG